MTELFDAIIVGGGVAGAASFAHLAQRGYRVLLLEKGRAGLGSSAFSGGILRCYDPHPGLRAMAMASWADFQAMPQQGGPAPQTCGFLYFVPAGQEACAQELAALPSPTPLRWLSQAEGAAAFPHIKWEDLAGAVYEPQAAFMDPLAAVRHWLEQGRRQGQQVLEGVRFHGLAASETDALQLYSTIGLLHCRRLILCPGAWAPQLAAHSGIALPQPLRSKAIQLNSLRCAAPVTQPAYIDPALDLYGRAGASGQIHVGAPVPAWDIDPDHAADLCPSHLAATQRQAQRRFAWADASQGSGGWRRFDAWSEDGLPLLAPAPGQQHVIWASGLSGGGFKLAPELARRIEALAFSS